MGITIMKNNLYRWAGKKVFHRMNPGFSAYGVIPTKDAVTYLVNERLLNNLPRYKSQAHHLTTMGEFEVTNLGLILRFGLSSGTVSLKIVEEVALVTQSKHVKRLPSLPWKKKSALMRFMAAQEVTLWP